MLQNSTGWAPHHPSPQPPPASEGALCISHSLKRSLSKSYRNHYNKTQANSFLWCRSQTIWGPRLSPHANLWYTKAQSNMWVHHYTLPCIHFSSFALKDGFWTAENPCLVHRGCYMKGFWQHGQQVEAKCVWIVKVMFAMCLQQLQWALCGVLSTVRVLCTFWVVCVFSPLCWWSRPGGISALVSSGFDAILHGSDIFYLNSGFWIYWTIICLAFLVIISQCAKLHWLISKVNILWLWLWMPDKRS